MQQGQHRHWKCGLAVLFILGTAPGALSTVSSARCEDPRPNPLPEGVEECTEAAENGEMDLEKCFADSTCNLAYADLRDVPNLDLSQRNLKGCNLTCVDLTGFNFAEADLTDAMMDFSCLNGANLYKISGQRLSLTYVTAMKADFSEADISGEQEASANFEGGMFQGSTFDKANLKAATITDADFSECVDSSGNPTATSFMEANLESITGSNADFTGASFSMAQLTDFDCKNCTFDYVDMSNLDITDGMLMGASFVGADLSNAKFEDIVLQDVNFTDADMSGIEMADIELNGAQLEGVDLSGAKMEDIRLAGANLQNADLSNAELADMSFKGVNADGATFAGSFLEGADFRCSDLRGTDWTGADLGKANFADADLRGGSIFSEAQGVETSFCGADLVDADFTDSVFTKSFFGTQCGEPGGELDLVTTVGHGANLTGADFSGADVWESDFQGSEGFPLHASLVEDTRFDMNPEKRQNFNEPLPPEEYYLISDELEWEEALERCQRLGLTLAFAPNVSSDPVQEFLVMQANGKGRSAWIGLRRPVPNSAFDHQFIMGSGQFSEISFATRWDTSSDQPKDNIHCAFMSKKADYDWKSKRCTDKARAVCSNLPCLLEDCTRRCD